MTQVLAYTISLTPRSAITSSHNSGFSFNNFMSQVPNPIDYVTENVGAKINEMADAITIAAKQLFMDATQFLFVDLLGRLSVVAIMAGCVTIMLGSKTLSTKMITGGCVGSLISYMVALGWS